MISENENEHLRQRMLFSRLDDKWYLVTPEIFRSKEDYVFVTVSKILDIKILKTKNVSVSNRFGAGTYFFEWKKELSL